MVIVDLSQVMGATRTTMLSMRCPNHAQRNGSTMPEGWSHLTERSGATTSQTRERRAMYMTRATMARTTRIAIRIPMCPSYPDPLVANPL